MPLLNANGERVSALDFEENLRIVNRLYKVEGTVVQNWDFTGMDAIKVTNIEPILFIEGCTIDRLFAHSWTGTFGGLPVHYSVTELRRSPQDISDLEYTDHGPQRKESGLIDGKIYRMRLKLNNFDSEYTDPQTGMRYSPVKGQGVFALAKTGDLELYRLSGMHQAADFHLVAEYPESFDLGANGMGSAYLMAVESLIIVGQPEVGGVDMTGTKNNPHSPAFGRRVDLRIQPSKISLSGAPSCQE